MRICDLVTGMGQLKRGAAQLKDRWMETKMSWSDETSRKFEKEHLNHLAPQITLTVATIHRLADLLEKAERDCEEEADELL